MNESTERQLLQDVNEIKTAFTGTLEKPGLTHVLVQINETMKNHEERLKVMESATALLNNERQQQIGVNRWFWPKVAALAAAVPGLIELIHFLTNKSEPPTH